MLETILISVVLTVGVSTFVLALIIKHAVNTGTQAVQKINQSEHFLGSNNETKQTIDEASKQWYQAFNTLKIEASNGSNLAIGLVVATIVYALALLFSLSGVYVTFYMYGVVALAVVNVLKTLYLARKAGKMVGTLTYVVQYVNRPENWMFYDDVEDKTYHFNPVEGWVETKDQGRPDLTKEEHGHE